MDPRPTLRLTGRPRKLLRAGHVVASGGWLGLVISMLVLGGAALAAEAPALTGAAYVLMGRIGGNAIPLLAVATLLTGFALSLATPWGLVRYWWVVVKTLLGLGVIVTAVTLTTGWIEQAQSGSAAAASAGRWLVGGSVAHLAMLGVATVVSVDKPWGRTPRGRSGRGRKGHRTPGARPRAGTHARNR